MWEVREAECDRRLIGLYTGDFALWDGHQFLLNPSGYAYAFDTYAEAQAACDRENAGSVQHDDVA